jgi:hypothetical protein
VLERPNLKAPGFVAHFTYNFGKGFAKPNRVVLTSLRGALGNQWDMQVNRAGGDSAMGFYWDPKEIGPGGKRSLAYGFGKGICAGLKRSLFAQEAAGHDSSAQESVKFPTGKAPGFFTVADIDKKEVELTGPGGAVYRSVLSDLEISDAAGTKLTAQDFRKRVKVGSIVLAASDENNIDAAYLGLLKKDTLVLGGVVVVMAKADRPGRGWTMDLNRMKPSKDPVAGRILGGNFNPDRIQLVNTGLSLQASSGNIHMFLNLRPGEGIAGKTFEFSANDPQQGGRPAIHVHVRSTTGLPQSAAYTTGYAMRMEFGREKDGVIPGKLYLCLPDEGKSFIAGSFSLNLQ